MHNGKSEIVSALALKNYKICSKQGTYGPTSILWGPHLHPPSLVDINEQFMNKQFNQQLADVWRLVPGVICCTKGPLLYIKRKPVTSIIQLTVLYLYDFNTTGGL